MKMPSGKGWSMAIMTIAMLVPPVIASLLGHPSVAGALILPVLAGLLPAQMAGVRTGLAAAVGVAVASGAAVAVTGDALLGALVMGVTSLATGLACRWGRSKNLIIVIITVGFVVCAPPTVVSSNPSVNGLALGTVTLAAALWGVLVGWFNSKDAPQPPHNLESWARTWSYAVILAILAAIAAYVSIEIDWKHAGAWFILTIAVVFQPYLKDSLQRTWQRAAGTILGVVAAFLIHLVIPWHTALTILGFVLIMLSLFVMTNPRYPYWAFVTLLTPGIVLVASTADTFEQTNFARLIATLAGAGLAFVAELALAPLYRASAKRHGHTDY